MFYDADNGYGEFEYLETKWGKWIKNKFDKTYRVANLSKLVPAQIKSSFPQRKDCYLCRRVICLISICSLENCYVCKREVPLLLIVHTLLQQQKTDR